jgi:hypothetical protein
MKNDAKFRISGLWYYYCFAFRTAVSLFMHPGQSESARSVDAVDPDVVVKLRKKHDLTFFPAPNDCIFTLNVSDCHFAIAFWTVHQSYLQVDLK